MTPEDVRKELNTLRREADLVVSIREAMYDPSFASGSRTKEIQRIVSWKFNEFHDGANHTIGEYRFWFKIVENGYIKAGYEHRSPVEGTTRAIPYQYHLGEFKNIKSLHDIDALFRFTSPAYK